MADTIDYGALDHPDTTSARLSPEQLQTWIGSQQARLDAGLPLGKQGIPPGFKVDNGRIVPTNWWDDWGKGAAVTVGGGLAAGYGAAVLNNAIAPGMSASAASAPAAAPSAAPATSIPGAFGHTAVDTVSSVAPGASSVPKWLVPALEVGAPYAINAAMRGGGSGETGTNGLTPEQQAMVTRLMQLAAQRQEQSAPVHQAAMLLAQRLGPTGSWGDSPRFQQAVQQTTGQGPSPQSNPQLAAAMQRLMGT